MGRTSLQPRGKPLPFPRGRLLAPLPESPVPVTSHDIDAILIEASGRIALGKPGVAVSTDEPLVFRRRVYPRMKALGLRFYVKIPPQPMEVWLLPSTEEPDEEG